MCVRQATAALAAAVLTAGCVPRVDQPPSAAALRQVHSVSADGDTTFFVERDDPDLNAARYAALCSLDEFVRRLVAPPPTQRRLMLKAEVADSAAVEHLWLRPLAAVGDTAFRGVVANDPSVLRRAHYGDTMTVTRGVVDDWFAVDRDTLVGGFSIRARRARLHSDAARARDDSLQGYVVDDDARARARLPSRCVRPSVYPPSPAAYPPAPSDDP